MNILFIIFCWRILLFAVSYITLHRFSFTPTFPYSDIYLIPSQLPGWVWSWANFDGVHYLTIAKGGYWAQFTQAFFPLYPLLIKILSLISHDRYLIISGLLISFAAFCISLFMLIKLLNLDYPQASIKKIIFIILIFPTSFYFAALYTESIFFLWVISAFYFARVKKWWLSGTLAALASATRITGILLLPALLWEWNQNKIKNQKSTLRLRSGLMVSEVEPSNIKREFNENEQKILKILTNGEAQYDEIVRTSGLPAAQVGSLLTQLELSGVIITSDNGKYYLR